MYSRTLLDNKAQLLYVKPRPQGHMHNSLLTTYSMLQQVLKTELQIKIGVVRSHGVLCQGMWCRNFYQDESFMGLL